MQDFYVSAGADHIKLERGKARELRKTRWWSQQLDQGTCYYCERKFGREELTMDHKVPLARGGRTTKNNVVVCCKDCNSAKQAKTSAELALEEI